MTMKQVILWTFLAAVPFAVTGFIVSGLAGLKLALGIVGMFGITAASIVFALDQIELERR